jgi:CheY-like chemotaxis protein/HPt (histidine-containing phosphotransfer) domain-containing protein
VRLAGDGLQALEILAAESFDAVLMDCHMPAMDGFEATAELRRLEGEGPRLPVIAMTAGVLAEDRARCVEAGMDDFVPKPVDLDVLREVLERWVPQAPTDTDEHAGTGTGAAGASAPGPGAERAVLDPARLAVLRSLPGPGPDGLLEVVAAAFAADAPARLEALRDAARAGDAAALARAAHALKGAAANLGALAVARLSGELEALGRGGATGAAVPMLAELEEESRAALAALHQAAGPSV